MKYLSASVRSKFPLDIRTSYESNRHGALSTIFININLTSSLVQTLVDPRKTASASHNDAVKWSLELNFWIYCQFSVFPSSNISSSFSWKLKPALFFFSQFAEDADRYKMDLHLNGVINTNKVAL